MDFSSNKRSINTTLTDRLSTDKSFSSTSSMSNDIKIINQKKKKNDEQLQLFISNKLNEMFPDKKYLNTYNQ